MATANETDEERIKSKSKEVEDKFEVIEKCT